MTRGGAGDAGPLVLVGPSGAGKTTIAGRLVELHPERFVFSVSTTTRPPRAGERSGREYHFVSRAEFMDLVARGDLAEWAKVHGQYYGTPVANLSAPEDGDGRTPVLDIDVQGARQVLDRVPQAVALFVLPPDPETWIGRLAGRGTEAPSEIARRLRTAVGELGAASSFGAFVVNGDVDAAVRDVLAAFDGDAPARSPRADSGRAAPSARRLCRELEAGALSQIERLAPRRQDEAGP